MWENSAELPSLFVGSAKVHPAPKPALVHQTNVLLMSTWIYKSILNLVKHITLLPDNTLAKKVLDEQVDNNWDGLVSEAIEVAKKMNIIGLMDGNIGKKAFKNIVKKKAR